MDTKFDLRQKGIDLFDELMNHDVESNRVREIIMNIAENTKENSLIEKSENKREEFFKQIFAAHDGNKKDMLKGAFNHLSMRVAEAPLACMADSALIVLSTVIKKIYEMEEKTC